MKSYKCLNCRRVFKSSSSLFRFLASDGRYSMLCGNCFKKALIENGHNDLAVRYKGKIYEIKDMNQRMLRAVCECVDVKRMNMLFSNPEKLKDCMKTAKEEVEKFKRSSEK